MYFFFFFFNDTATTEIYTLSLHDALPISIDANPYAYPVITGIVIFLAALLDSLRSKALVHIERSEEHTSELQSQSNLVCRLLLEKKKNYTYHTTCFCHTVFLHL